MANCLLIYLIFKRKVKLFLMCNYFIYSSKIYSAFQLIEFQNHNAVDFH